MRNRIYIHRAIAISKRTPQFANRALFFYGGLCACTQALIENCFHPIFHIYAISGVSSRCCMWKVVVEVVQNMTGYPMHERVGENHGKFHWLFLGEQTSTRNRYDRAILETRNFVVMPSLGSLVAGWLLVVPRTPLAGLWT